VEKYATLISGLLVVGIGLWMLVRRLRGGHGHDHHHHHHGHDPDHAHPAGKSVESVKEPGRVRRWELIGLGVSGGIVPCPDALVVLLLGISLGRTALGLLLVAVFSLGMAVTLVGLGIVWVYSSGALRRLVPEKVIRVVLVASPIVIGVLGLVIVWSGVQKFVSP
jgi:nickel/cobalt exporter